MISYKRTKVKTDKIKTGIYQPENSEKFIATLSALLKTIMPIECPVVHKDTMQLIANGHYLQLAQEHNDEEVDVILADFPEEELIHAVVTHWKPTTKFAKMFKLIAILMKYYAKGGAGAKYRSNMEEKPLRELVAEFLGTNRTYLDWIEAIGNFNPGLLDLVDKGEVSLKEAFAMVPKPGGRKKGGNSGGNDGGGSSKNYTIPVLETNSLSAEEIETLIDNLPQKYSEQIANAVIPNELSISKAFTYDNTFQGFTIAYEDTGKAVITNIAYIENMTSLLKAA